MRQATGTSNASGEVEQLITKLLRTTKGLLETLTHWSIFHATNDNIYELHDTLEKQFYLVSHAFEEAGIGMSDLQWIPQQLRESVSIAILNTPSPSVLEQHLPRIREVIVHLLQGLKGKQALLKDKESYSPVPTHNTGDSWTRPNQPTPTARSSSSRMPTSPGFYPPQSPGFNIPVDRRPSNPYENPYPPSIKSPNRTSSHPTSPRVHMHMPRLDSVNPQPALSNPEEIDPNSALAALKRQENLARRSSVRRTSLYRGGGSEYSGGSISRAPPVPTLPSGLVTKGINSDFDRSPQPSKLESLSETQEVISEESTDNKDQALTLFLQIGKQVQKVQYNGEISISALNMLFLEKFSYTIGQNDFPKIYIRDPKVGISYELIDLSEIKNNSVLSFNIDENEEQKETQKEWMNEMKTAFNKELVEIRNLFAEQLNEIKTQLNQTQPIQPTLPQPEPTTPPQDPDLTQLGLTQAQFDLQRTEIERLRRDLAVLRQLEKELKQTTADVIADIKSKAEQVKQQADTQVAVARTHLEEGKKALVEKSEKITNQLEDLQDTIDQLRLDVTQRKCRPSEAQMAHCAKERKDLTDDIEAFGKFIVQVKPRWKKTWEQELQTIVKEQQILKDQEQLLADMRDDLDALLEVYEPLEKFCAYQANARPQVREFRVAPPEEGSEGMASVFKQVQSIDVDHERRLKALEQAEKMRQREAANRTDEFEKELAGFVGAKKLKKTGGAEEIERIRKLKDEEIRKALFAEKQAALAKNNSTAVETEES